MKSSVAAEYTSGRSMKPGLSFDASSFTNSEEDFLTVLEFISNLDISGSVTSGSPVLQGEELLTPDCGRGKRAQNSVDSAVVSPSEGRKGNSRGYAKRTLSPASKHGKDVVDNFLLNDSLATDKDALNANAAVTEAGPIISSTAWVRCQVETAKSGSYCSRSREHERVEKRGIESVSLLENRSGNGAPSVGAHFHEVEPLDTPKLGLVGRGGTTCADVSTASSGPVNGATVFQVQGGSAPSKGSKKSEVPDPGRKINASSTQSRRYSSPDWTSLEVIPSKGLAIRTPQWSGVEFERGPSIQHLTRSEMSRFSLPVNAKKSDMMRRHSIDGTQKLHPSQVELLSLPRRAVCTNGSGRWRDLDQLYEEMRLAEDVRDDVMQRAVKGKKASVGRHHTDVATSSVNASNRQVWDKPGPPAEQSCDERLCKDKRRTHEVSRATVSVHANNLGARTRSARHVTGVDDCSHVELDAGKCTGKRRNVYSLNVPRQEEMVADKGSADILTVKARYDRSKVSRSANGVGAESSTAQQSNSGIIIQTCQQPLRPLEQRRDSYPLFSVVDKPTNVLDVPFLSKRSLVPPPHHPRLSSGSEISEACDNSPRSSTDSNATLKQLLYLQKYREVCTLRQALQEEDSDTVSSRRKGSVSSRSNGSWHKEHVVDTMCYCYVRNSSGKAIGSEKTSKTTQRHTSKITQNVGKSLSDGRNMGLDRSLASQSISMTSLSSHGTGLSLGKMLVPGEGRHVCRACPQENSAPARISYECSSSKKGDLQNRSFPDGLTLVERVFNDNGYFQRSNAASTLSKASNVEHMEPESITSCRWTDTFPQSMKFPAMSRAQQHPGWDREQLGGSKTDCVACEALNLEDRSRTYSADSPDFSGGLRTWEETMKSRQPRGPHVFSLPSPFEKDGEYLKLDDVMEGKGLFDKGALLTGGRGGTYAGVATTRHETPWRKMGHPWKSHRSSRYSFPSDELENVEKFLQETESCPCCHRHSSSETPFEKKISGSVNGQSHFSTLSSGSGLSFDCPGQSGVGQQRRSLSPFQDRRLTIWSFYTEVTFFEGIVRLAKVSLRNFCACLINCREEFLDYESRELAALLRNFLPEAQFAEAEHRHFGIQACLNDTIFLHFHEESYGLDPARYAFPSTRFRREVFLEKFHRLSCVFPEQGINMPHKHVHNGELQDFYQFCRRKLSMIQKRMGLKIESWPRLLLHSFFDAMKQVWRVHKLAFSLEPPATMLYIDRGTDFNETYMELVDMHSMIGDFVISGAKWNFVPHMKGKLPSAARNSTRPEKIPGDPPSEATVDFMVMPGFEAKSKILKSQVYLKPRTA